MNHEFSILQFLTLDLSRGNGGKVTLQNELIIENLILSYYKYKYYYVFKLSPSWEVGWNAYAIVHEL